MAGRFDVKSFLLSFFLKELLEEIFYRATWPSAFLKMGSQVNFWSSSRVSAWTEKRNWVPMISEMICLQTQSQPGVADQR